MSFSGEVAGKEEEPGRVMPSTSAVDAIVFAVYICRRISFSTGKDRNDPLRRMHLAPDRHVAQYRSASFLLVPFARLVGIGRRIGMRRRCRVEEHLRRSQVGLFHHTP